MDRRVLPQIGARQSQQGRRRSRSVLLPMDERARQLDEPFVEGTVGPLALSQPEWFQHLVRFEELLPPKALEEVEVVLIAWLIVVHRHSEQYSSEPHMQDEGERRGGQMLLTARPATPVLHRPYTGIGILMVFAWYLYGIYMY